MQASIFKPPMQTFLGLCYTFLPHIGYLFKLTSALSTGFSLIKDQYKWDQGVGVLEECS